MTVNMVHDDLINKHRPQTEIVEIFLAAMIKQSKIMNFKL